MDNKEDLKYIIKHLKYTLVDSITKKEGAPEEKDYHPAHLIANKNEKLMFPDGFKALNAVIKAHPKEWLGDNFKGGRIIVSKIVPEQHRTEVAFHEYIERRELDRMEKKDSSK